MSQSEPTKIQRPQRPELRPLISVFTVMILSAMLLGMSIGSELDHNLQALASIMGLTGLIAYIGLDHVSERRLAEAERAEQEFFQSRLVQHIVSNRSLELDHDELLEIVQSLTSRRTAEKPVPTGSRV